MVDRRTALIMMAGAASQAVIGLPALAAGEYQLKFSSYLPPANYANRVLQEWCDELRKRSNGRLDITLFTSGQLGPLPRQYDLARTGVADFSYAMVGGTPGRFPLTELAQLPYTMPSASVGAQALTSLLPDYLATEYQGVHVLFLYTTEPIPVFTTKVAIHHPSDLKGLRIRPPDPISAATLKAMGATPVAIAPGELADSLTKGTIDGVLLGWEAVETFQIGTGVKYGTDWQGPVTAFAITMNRDTYQKLPADLRTLIDETGGMPLARKMGIEAEKAVAGGRAYMRKYNVVTVDLTPTEKAEFVEVSESVVKTILTEKQAKVPTAKKFFAALKEKAAFYSHK